MTSKNPNIKVRPARASDLNRIRAIEEKSFEYPWPTRAFQWKLGEVGFFVCQLEGEVAGFIIAQLDQAPLAYSINKVFKILGIDRRFERLAHIQNLAVDPIYRRIGVASKLLDHLIGICTSKKIEHIRLEVRTENEGAVKFYESRGFARVKVLKSYYENGDDAYLMKKDL